MLATDVRELQRYLVWGQLSPQVTLKSWSNLARERSLEVRRRKARLSENARRLRAIRGMVDESEFVSTVVKRTVEAASSYLRNVPMRHFTAVRKTGSLRTIVTVEGERAMSSALAALGGRVYGYSAPVGLYGEDGRIIVDLERMGRYDNEHTFLHEFGHAVFKSIENGGTQLAMKLYDEVMNAHVAEWKDISPYTLRKQRVEESFADAYMFYLKGGEVREALAQRAPDMYAVVKRVISGNTNWWHY